MSSRKSSYRIIGVWKTTRPVFEVANTDIEEQLQRVREQNATEQEVDRPAELGDVVVADLQELDENGLPIIGRKQEERPFHIGGSNANHDLDNQLVGISTGETRQIRLTHAEGDEHESQAGGAQHQAGREIRMMFSAREIRERTLPELDDEFARDQGQFESLEEFRTQIRTDLQAQADFASRRYLEGHIVDELIRKNAFDLPETMIENALDTLVENQKKEREGHDDDIDEEAIRRESREGTIRGLKRHLYWRRFRNRKIWWWKRRTWTARLDVMSRRYNTEREQLRQILKRSDQIERIESNLLTEKNVRSADRTRENRRRRGEIGRTAIRIRDRRENRRLWHLYPWYWRRRGSANAPTTSSPSLEGQYYLHPGFQLTIPSQTW